MNEERQIGERPSGNQSLHVTETAGRHKWQINYSSLEERESVNDSKSGKNNCSWVASALRWLLEASKHMVGCGKVMPPQVYLEIQEETKRNMTTALFVWYCEHLRIGNDSYARSSSIFLLLLQGSRSDLRYGYPPSLYLILSLACLSSGAHILFFIFRKLWEVRNICTRLKFHSPWKL